MHHMRWNIREGGKDGGRKREICSQLAALTYVDDEKTWKAGEMSDFDEFNEKVWKV